jgi:rubrerythrin
MGEEIKSMEDKQDFERSQKKEKKVYLCDRCGFKMVETNCKVECPNCGNRFDCSDLNIYFD